ncbi:Metallo-dependent phosphatase-like protein [Aspergillus karnatakaensis]|uniref:metallophosphatase domain-containing protein n=1 Tax=Aspergillus karnatakaensis TaxID=1810916 RepID=UPI003CCCEDB9
MELSTRVPTIKTRFLILSDTHGHDLHDYSAYRADVAIHCGDLTTESKRREFVSAINLSKTLDTPLKLVIAGNHDFILDIPMFQKKVTEVITPLDPALVQKEYGDYGEIRKLFEDARESGIILLEEGTYDFKLQNDARLKIYASPYTPSLGDWGFQYHPETGHMFDIETDTDVVVTHGPPRGILDMTYSGGRAGCPRLFEAIARARPKMHCFGHIHEGWGAKLVGWREKVSKNPSHLTDIDNGRSVMVRKLSQIKQDIPAIESSHCAGDENSLEVGIHTLFVNAALEGSEELPIHPVWQIDLELPRQI